MISVANEYTVILDACVLLPISLTDILLRLAEDPALYCPRWSRHILGEIERNLQIPKFGLTPEKARYRIACMESAFPEAMVTGYEPLIQLMENGTDDRHVLAAAVRAKADAILTANSKDFAEACLKPLGIKRLTPDQFLLHQWHLDSKLVAKKLRSQAEDSGRSLESLLELLGKMVPKFAAAARAPEA
jgi:predicted nucleic acid-binding protein